MPTNDDKTPATVTSLASLRCVGWLVRTGNWVMVIELHLKAL